MEDLIKELQELVKEYKRRAKPHGMPGEYYDGLETAYDTAAGDIQDLIYKYDSKQKKPFTIQEIIERLERLEYPHILDPYIGDSMCPEQDMANYIKSLREEIEESIK